MNLFLTGSRGVRQDETEAADHYLVIIQIITVSHNLICPDFQLGKVYGIESHVLSPAETKDLYPLMNVDDLYGTLYVPKDGTMDPAGTCTTLTRAASARGATVTRARPRHKISCIKGQLAKLGRESVIRFEHFEQLERN